MTEDGVLSRLKFNSQTPYCTTAWASAGDSCQHRQSESSLKLGMIFKHPSLHLADYKLQTATSSKHIAGVNAHANTHSTNAGEIKGKQHVPLNRKVSVQLLDCCLVRGEARPDTFAW